MRAKAARLVDRGGLTTAPVAAALAGRARPARAPSRAKERAPAKTPIHWAAGARLVSTNVSLHMLFVLHVAILMYLSWVIYHVLGAPWANIAVKETLHKAIRQRLAARLEKLRPQAAQTLPQSGHGPAMLGETLGDAAEVLVVVPAPLSRCPCRAYLALRLPRPTPSGPRRGARRWTPSRRD